MFGNKTQAMTELTRQVVKSMRNVNPDLILSISPNPYQFSLSKYSLDWLGWVKENLFDEVVIQIYRLDSNSVRQSILNSRIKEASNYAKVAVGIYVGGDKYFKSFTEINRQVDVVKEFGYGYSLFCWEYNSNLFRHPIYWLRTIRLVITKAFFYLKIILN